MSARRCCDETECPREILSRLVDPSLDLRKKVGEIGGEVGRICGRLDRGELQNCFGKLFHLTPECSLYDSFEHACRSAAGEATQAAATGSSGSVAKVRRLMGDLPEDVFPR